MKYTIVSFELGEPVTPNPAVLPYCRNIYVVGSTFPVRSHPVHYFAASIGLVVLLIEHALDVRSRCIGTDNIFASTFDQYHRCMVWYIYLGGCRL